MAKIEYVSKRFSGRSLAAIENANAIIEEYMAAGYRLTLRQLYYQFVSRALIPNRVSEYVRLGSIVNKARLAGLIDWNAIEDRTRNLASLPHWTDPASIVDACASQFMMDKWAGQKLRIEVWIEKEALAGVFQRVCNDLDVPFFCCRGYTSQSEMWSGAMRLAAYAANGQTPYILHFGDHDPSGIDMTRDIRDRMAVFGCDMRLDRLALNIDQVDRYQPPPNPAKETDSRFAGYIREFGNESWELDALEPQVLAGLVRDSVVALRDDDAWTEAVEEELGHRKLLRTVSRRWDEITEAYR